MRPRQLDSCAFATFDPADLPPLVWPTSRRDLGTNPDGYTARTRVNPAYGLPGWTRDCGKRFHRGCDIAPIKATPTGRTVTVMFTDCATGHEYPSDEPALRPEDSVFALADGRVVDAVTDPNHSDFGCYVMVEHPTPTSCFYSLYAHLDRVDVAVKAVVVAGQTLGTMGQTSRSEEARRWMAMAPHLHLEVWDRQGRPLDPLQVLRAGLIRS